jgi:hypothetical protein
MTSARWQPRALSSPLARPVDSRFSRQSEQRRLPVAQPSQGSASERSDTPFVRVTAARAFRAQWASSRRLGGERQREVKSGPSNHAVEQTASTSRSWRRRQEPRMAAQARQERAAPPLLTASVMQEG